MGVRVDVIKCGAPVERPAVDQRVQLGARSTWGDAAAGAAVDLPRRGAVDRREERAVGEDAAVDDRVPRDVRDAAVAADDPGDGRLG